MEKQDRNAILQLFITFFEIGAFTFGGGYAMIPLIQREVVESRHWISDSDLLDIIAIAESTPGVIAVNTATFVGYKVRGFLGALSSTLGVALPSFIIISILSFFIDRYSSNPWVGYAFLGIRASVIVLILNAVVKLKKNCPKDLFSYILIGTAFALSAIFSLNAIFILLGAGITGLAFHIYSKKRGGDAK